MIHILQAMVSS